MSKIQNEVDDDGLTPDEKEYLTAPVSQMTPDQRVVAMSIRVKRDNKRWADNAASREKERVIRDSAKIRA